LDWIGIDWIGLDWIGLDWIGLDWLQTYWCHIWLTVLSLDTCTLPCARHAHIYMYGCLDDVCLPAGTGKTEAVKDLGKALGCSDATCRHELYRPGVLSAVGGSNLFVDAHVLSCMFVCLQARARQRQ
jgi:hypothetical protein